MSEMIKNRRSGEDEGEVKATLCAKIGSSKLLMTMIMMVMVIDDDDMTRQHNTTQHNTKP